jgi:hypothetical protein
VENEMRKPVKHPAEIVYTICHHEEIVFSVGICGVRLRVRTANRVRKGSTGDDRGPDEFDGHG